MKKKLLLVLVIAIIAMTNVFAITTGAATGLDSDTLKPVQIVLLIFKVAAVLFMIFFVLKTIIQVLKADQQQRGQILMHNLIYIAIAAVLLMLCFGLPKLFSLDDIVSVDDSGSACIVLVEDFVTSATNLI